MSKLILIRHGQASFGSKDYDQLSPLGQQQSVWLGEYLKEIELKPTRIIRGDLKRHIQTTQGIESGLGYKLDQEQCADWNEFDFQEIGRAFLASNPDLKPDISDPKSFFSILRKGLLAWSNNEISGTIEESWLEFEARVIRALTMSVERTDNETVLVISSGGTISMVLKQLMNFTPETTIDLNLQTRNTGLSEVFFNQHQRYVASFNNVPHMQSAQRMKSITST